MKKLTLCDIVCDLASFLNWYLLLGGWNKREQWKMDRRKHKLVRQLFQTAKSIHMQFLS